MSRWIERAGWLAPCKRCDARLTIHQRSHKLRCHHCGAEAQLPATCPACGSGNLHGIGEGTERIETALARLFPQARIERIDRDSTRRKGSLEEGRTLVLHGIIGLRQGDVRREQAMKVESRVPGSQANEALNHQAGRHDQHDRERYLPRNKQVIEATLALIHGGTPDLPTRLPPAARDLVPAVELEPVDVAAEQLRQRLEQGTATEEDLAQLYFAL